MYYLYRHFDIDSTLLYVGISLSAVHRLSQHKLNSLWFKMITRVEIEQFSTKEDALRAEKAAIIQERPIYNIQSSTVNFNKIQEASYHLTLNEHRLILFCITQLNSDKKWPENNTFSINAIDFSSMFYANKKTVYRDLKSAAVRLERREILIEEGFSKNILVYRWINNIKYMESEGRVCLRFNKDMLPYLTALTEQFTKYQLKAVAKMNSAYAIRLYELLAQWREKGHREVELAWLREALQVGDKYPVLMDFKKRVIETAVAQINEHSDLKVSYEQRKTGRVVSHFRFVFSPKQAAPDAKPRKAKTTAAGHISRDDIQKNARPGESWEDAKRRLGRKAEA